VNILDENVPESQRALLRHRRVAIRQIGLDLGRKGMKVREIITLLHHRSGTLANQSGGSTPPLVAVMHLPVGREKWLALWRRNH
jgi:hypothetical protein